MLTTFDADEHVLRALRAGASGFLLKDTPPRRDRRGGAHGGGGGEPILSPTVTRQLIAHVADADVAGPRRDEARELLAVLTEREREVALAVGRGPVQRGDRRASCS